MTDFIIFIPELAQKVNGNSGRDDFAVNNDAIAIEDEVLDVHVRKELEKWEIEGIKVWRVKKIKVGNRLL